MSVGSLAFLCTLGAECRDIDIQKIKTQIAYTDCATGGGHAFALTAHWIICTQKKVQSIGDLIVIDSMVLAALITLHYVTETDHMILQ